MTDWDVVVVGGGAAGLSAGMTLARARRSVLVVDAGEPRNAPADGMHNYLGREGAPPSALLADGRADVQRYGGVVRAGTVTDAAAVGDGFAVTLDDGTRHAARRLVLATGLVDELPDVGGVRERWGRDVLHCPYCHGWEVRDRRLGVLATSPMALHQVQLFRQWSDDVVLLLNDALELSRTIRDELDAREIEVVTGAVSHVVVGPGPDATTGAVPADALTGVELVDGRRVALEALVVASTMRARGEVAAMLGLALTPFRTGEHVVGEYLETDEFGLTAVPGVWAAGNVTDLRAQVIVAAGQGVSVAAAVNADLVADDVRLALRAHRDGSPEFRERLYAAHDGVWGERANAALETTVDGLPPGTALDLGAGGGGEASRGRA